MAKDYYLILGVSADATLEEIKAAYRRAAKRCHPDMSGEGSEPFLVIQEAYEVLGDTRRRQAYDDDLARQNREQRRAWAARPEPLRQTGAPAEPLVPGRYGSRPQDLFFGSPFSSLLAELFGRPGPHVAAGAERRGEPEELHVRVRLTPDQARRGGRVRVWIPVQVPCPACRGRGGDDFFECLHCFGSGTVPDERPVDVTFPDGVVDGYRGRVSLVRLGIHDLSLVLHFSVAGG